MYNNYKTGRGGFQNMQAYPNAVGYETGAYQPFARRNTGPAYDLMETRQPTERTRQDWLIANANARVAAQPWYGPYTQLDAPMVQTHLDPHALHQNPLDPFLDNIFYTVSTYRGRNTNFDLRGQPDLPYGWNMGHEQNIQPEILERLHHHGESHQIAACRAPRAPRY